MLEYLYKSDVLNVLVTASVILDSCGGESGSNDRKADTGEDQISLYFDEDVTTEREHITGEVGYYYYIAWIECNEQLYVEHN